jgi:hypothetical protein
MTHRRLWYYLDGDWALWQATHHACEDTATKIRAGFGVAVRIRERKPAGAPDALDLALVRQAMEAAIAEMERHP